MPNVYPWAGNDGVSSCGIVAAFNSEEENWKCSLGSGPTYSKSISELYNVYLYSYTQTAHKLSPTCCGNIVFSSLKKNSEFSHLS